MQSYKTIDGRAEAEIVEKKSRFIAHVCHTDTEDDALLFLDEIRTLHAQAKHNVYAYVLRGGRVRYSDDGEPGGTAGMPTLQAIQGAQLEDVTCVVTRYFGGTLLGTGGLVRAYTQATQAAIEAAHIVEISKCVDIDFTVPYPQYEHVLHMAKSENAKILETDFAESVSMKLRMLSGSEESFLQRLSEMSRGKLDISVSVPYDAAF